MSEKTRAATELELEQAQSDELERRRQLVTIKTRVPRTIADDLHDLAKQRGGSVAAELRNAIDKHLAAAADDRYREQLQRTRTDARKDGRK